MAKKKAGAPPGDGNGEVRVGKVKKFEGLFEVFDVTARRLRNGNKLRVVLEAPYDKAEEKRLIDFKFSEVRMAMEKFESQPVLAGIGGPGGVSEETEAELRATGVI